MLCSTSVAVRGAFLQRSLVPRLIEITPKGFSNLIPSLTFAVSSFSPLVYTLSWTKSFKMLIWKWLKCNSDEVNVKSRLIVHLPETTGSIWDGSSNTTRKLVSYLSKEWAGGWGLPLSLLPVWPSQLTLNPLITVQHRVMWQLGLGPGMYTWVEAAVICVCSWSTLYPYFHKHCCTSQWGTLPPVLLQLKHRTVPAKHSRLFQKTLW